MSYCMYTVCIGHNTGHNMGANSSHGFVLGELLNSYHTLALVQVIPLAKQFSRLCSKV